MPEMRTRACTPKILILTQKPDLVDIMHRDDPPPALNTPLLGCQHAVADPAITGTIGLNRIEREMRKKPTFGSSRSG